MIISVTNNKGGIGKSSITQNLAHALANKGKRVLVIDQDPQANTTSVLAPPPGANTLYDLYSGNIQVTSCIYPTAYENLDIIPNCNKTDTLEVKLYADVKKSYFLLRDKAREIANQRYEYTLIDSPPNLGMFCLMGLICADSAIIPIEAGSRYSIEGFINAFDAITAASQEVNHDLKFLKAVINKIDLRTSIHKASVEYLRRSFGDKIFDATIPLNTDIQKAEADAVTVIRYNPHSNGAKRFKILAEELLELTDV